MKTNMPPSIENLTFEQGKQNLIDAGFSFDPSRLNRSTPDRPIEVGDTTPDIPVGEVNREGFDFSGMSQEDMFGNIFSMIRGMAQPNQEIAQGEEVVDEQMRSLIEMLGQSELQDVEQLQLQQEAGIPELKRQQRDIMSQITSAQAGLTQQLADEAGRPVSQQFKTGREGEMTRQAAAKVQGLSAINQALQGNIDSANEAINNQLTLKYGVLKSNIASLSRTIEANQDRLSKKEQRLAEKRQAELNFMENRLAERIDKEKEASQSVILAMQNGLSASRGSELLSQINSGDIDPSDVFKTTGNFLVNPIDRAIKQRQLDKLNLEIESYESSYDVENGQFSSVIDSTVSLLGSERGKTVKKSITNALINGDYASATSQVENTIEEALTGENATKFGAQRNDYEVMTRLRNRIQEFENAGGDTGLLTGKAEEISRSLLGVSGDEQLTTLAVQLEREFQTYRTTMTGAAFSPEESRDYAKVNPRSTASLELNYATIDGARNQLNDRIVSTVETRVPGYENMRKIATGESTTEYVDAVDQVLQESGNFLDTYVEDLRKQ